MNEREAFKAGFLKHAAEQGLTVEETLALAKSANDWLTSLGGTALKFVGDRAAGLFDKTMGLGMSAAQKLVSTTAGMAPYAMIGAPLLGGAGLGYLAAKGSDLNDEDPDELKARELIDEYRRAAEQARQRRASKDQASAKPAYGRPVI